MKKIGPKNSTQEIFIRSLVHKLGYRFRLHRKDLPGKPDLVFPKYKKIIFVNGCFWHGHDKCQRSNLPSTNTAFWKEKIDKNKDNDQKCYNALKKMNWKYLIIWQCKIKKASTELLKNTIKEFLDTA